MDRRAEPAARGAFPVTRQPATNGGGSPSVRSSFSRWPASLEQQFRFAPSPAALLHYYNSHRKKAIPTPPSAGLYQPKIDRLGLCLGYETGVIWSSVRVFKNRGNSVTKHISAVAIALALSAGSALAADLPSRKEAPVYVPPPPPPLWTGFYAGLNAGYGWGATSNAGTVSLPLLDGVAAQANALDPLRQLPGTGLINGSTALANSGIANVNENGFIGGGQIGYNYQWSPNFVVGLEADFQGSTISGSGSYAGASQDSISWKDPFIPGLSPCVTNGCTLTRSAVGIGQVNAGVD